jgi:hypothetical protein
MKSLISLEDYRFQYPNSASIPTLTQSGLVGGLLDRHEKRVVRRAKRRAVWNAVFGLPFRGLAWIVDLFRPHHALAPARA